jgi:hypothetical protein
MPEGEQTLWITPCRGHRQRGKTDLVNYTVPRTQAERETCQRENRPCELHCAADTGREGDMPEGEQTLSLLAEGYGNGLYWFSGGSKISLNALSTLSMTTGYNYRL